jgi:hypothetical protein
MELVNPAAAVRKIALSASGAGAPACILSAFLLKDNFEAAGLATISIVVVVAAIALSMAAQPSDSRG